MTDAEAVATAPSSPGHADVQISSAILELKVMKLKRALASCIERQNQLQEDNAKLRALLETTGHMTDTNKTMANFYETKVSAFLSFLKEDNPELFALADECLNKKLTSDELSTKSALNHSIALVREKVKKEEDAKLNVERSIAAVASMTVNNATGTVDAEEAQIVRINEGAAAGNTPTPRQPNLRRDAIRPARLKSTDLVSVSADSPKQQAIERAVALRTQGFQDELSKQAETISRYKAEAEKYRLSEENARRNLAAIVVYQLKKSSAATKSSGGGGSAAPAKLAWQDAPDGLSPGPDVLQEAVKARMEDLSIGGGLSGSNVVTLPMMPSQQSKLAMRSRYGVFAEHSTAVHGRASSPLHKGINRAPPMKDVDPMTGTATRVEDYVRSGQSKGYAFRLATSVFLNDLGQLMRRADAVCQRLEIVHDRLIAVRVQQKATTGLDINQVLSIDEINEMADLVSADLDAEVPDTLQTNAAIHSLLDADGSWGEETQLLVLGRQTVLDFLQRRVEHWKQRVGAQIDIKHDPRKFKELMQATALAAQANASAAAENAPKSARHGASSKPATGSRAAVGTPRKR